MTTPRREKLLIALVREYIMNPQPVGSSALLSKLRTGCSSATIRNELKILEEDGYLCKSHTSSGRIPLKKAYRLYIDRLLEGEILAPKNADKIKQEFYHSRREIENLIHHASKILSELSHYTSFVLGPNLSKSVIKYLKLIKINPTSVMLVIVNGAGVINNKIIHFPHSVDEYDMERLTNLLNDRLETITAEQLKTEFLRQFSGLENVENMLFSVEKEVKNLINSYSGKIFCEGALNLLEVPGIKDLGKLKQVLELLNEEKFIARVMSKTISRGGIQVYMGSEFLPFDDDFSFITVSYSVKNALAGTMGILGPLRMHYEKVLPLVKFTAESFGRKLEKIF